MEEEHTKEKTSINRINKEVKKKQNKKVALKVIIGIVILIALFFSVRLLVQPPTDTSYNGFPFVKQGNFWYCNLLINGEEQIIPFNYHPSEVDEININPLIRNRIMAISPEGNIVLAVGEEENALSVVGTTNIARLHKLKYIRTPIHGAIYDESFNLTEYIENYNGTDDGPLRTNCGITNNRFVVIRFVSGDETTMQFSEETGNCIIATAAEPEDFRRLADRFTFEMLGIIRQ